MFVVRAQVMSMTLMMVAVKMGCFSQRAASPEWRACVCFLRWTRTRTRTWTRTSVEVGKAKKKRKKRWICVEKRERPARVVEEMVSDGVRGLVREAITWKKK